MREWKWRGTCQVLYCLTSFFIGELVHKLTEQIEDSILVDPNSHRCQSCLLPLFPHFLPLTRPQRPKKHIFSLPLIDTVEPWEPSAVVSVLCKMHAKHNSKKDATLWDTTGYLNRTTSPARALIYFHLSK